MSFGQKKLRHQMLLSTYSIPSSSSKARHGLTLALVLLAVLLGGYFLEYSLSIKCQAVVHPLRRWTFTEENPGVYLSRGENMLTGQISHYQFFEFERPAFLNLEFPIAASGDGSPRYCAEGDVVVQAHSSTLILQEARQGRALSQAQAHLDALMTGVKPSSIAAGKLSILRAKTDLETFEIQYARQKALLQENIISEADLDELEARRELMILDIALAEAELRVLESGADPGQIFEATALVPKLQAELEITREMLAALTIRSPMAGKLVTDVNNPRILLEVSPTDSMAVKLFISLDQSPKIVPGGDFTIMMMGRTGQPATKGTLVRIDEAVRIVDGGAFISAVGVFANAEAGLETGMRGTAHLDCGKVKIWQLIYHSVMQTVNRELPGL